MTKFIKTITVASLLLGLNSYGSTDKCEHTRNTLRCVKYISNYDGDTITVSIPGQHELFGELVSVRLNGIDTPEKRTRDICEKKLSKVAKDYLRYRILKSRSGTIELRNIQRGKYFRIVADLWVNGKNINKDMIKRGLAVSYFGDTKTDVDWCTFRPRVPKRMNRYLRRFED